MRDIVFLFGCHLRECAVIAVRHEDRVVSETVGALWLLSDVTIDDAFEGVGLSLIDEGDDSAESCFTLFSVLTFELLEHFLQYRFRLRSERCKRLVRH